MVLSACSLYAEGLLVSSGNISKFTMCFSTCGALISAALLFKEVSSRHNYLVNTSLRRKFKGGSGCTHICNEVRTQLLYWGLQGMTICVTTNMIFYVDTCECTHVSIGMMWEQDRLCERYLWYIYIFSFAFSHFIIKLLQLWIGYNCIYSSALYSLLSYRWEDWGSVRQRNLPSIFESVAEVELGPTGGEMKLCAALCHFSNNCYVPIIGLLLPCLVVQAEMDL